MAFTLPIELKREFTVNASYDKVFGVLADVPESISHFPKVESLENLGGNKWKIASEKVGISKYSVQTVYACDYHWDKDQGVVQWEPVPDVGNTEVSGRWMIEEQGDSVHVVLDTRAVSNVPLPKLAKSLVAPLAIREFEGMVDKYIENLIKTFNQS
ncbi:MAG: SRPBCC family protein [Desulfatibacillaceae bacterium]